MMIDPGGPRFGDAARHSTSRQCLQYPWSLSAFGLGGSGVGDLLGSIPAVAGFRILATVRLPKSDAWADQDGYMG